MPIYRVVLPGTVPQTVSPRSGPAGLAVLPFANISPDPQDEYFAVGLTEELITVLSQLRGLRVIARTSVEPYKSTSKRVSQIGEELGVSSILEGSVRKAGNRLRVTAQLIDVASEGHLWAETYDRELDDIFAVQTELAKQVAEALKIELRPSEGVRLGAKPVPRSDSYLAYLRGRTLLHSDTRASLEGARQQFELAMSLDPANAAAHSGLADVTRLTGWWFPEVPRSQWNETARQLAARAVELDPSLAEAHASLALAFWDEYDYSASEREFRLALTLNPSYSLAHHWYAALLEEENRAEEALVELTLAEGADPLWPVNLAVLAQLLLWLGRPDEALVPIRKIGQLEPSSPDYHAMMARYHLDRSELGLYVEERNRFLDLFADPRRKPLIRALTDAVSGEREKAREILRQEETQADIGQTAFDLAHVSAVLGDLDACFRWLGLAAQNHELPLQALRLDPRLKPVRDDPRFRQLLKKMNLA
jgi:TolB-like protein/tetratricopeptide (TPR) repeat protein